MPAMLQPVSAAKYQRTNPSPGARNAPSADCRREPSLPDAARQTTSQADGHGGMRHPILYCKPLGLGSSLAGIEPRRVRESNSPLLWPFLVNSRWPARLTRTYDASGRPLSFPTPAGIWAVLHFFFQGGGRRLHLALLQPLHDTPRPRLHHVPQLPQRHGHQSM